MCLDVVLPSYNKSAEGVAVHYEGQVLHCLLLHAVFPALVGGTGVWRVALTSKSLRFGVLLKATNGGLGMARLSLSEVWRIDRCFLAIPPSLVRPGWYVVTRGIWSIGPPHGWGCSVSA